MCRYCRFLCKSLICGSLDVFMCPVGAPVSLKCKGMQVTWTIRLLLVHQSDISPSDVEVTHSRCFSLSYLFGYLTHSSVSAPQLLSPQARHGWERSSENMPQWGYTYKYFIWRPKRCFSGIPEFGTERVPCPVWAWQPPPRQQGSVSLSPIESVLQADSFLFIRICLFKYNTPWAFYLPCIQRHHRM